MGCQQFYDPETGESGFICTRGKTSGPRHKRLTDEDIIPFGKYRLEGRKMKDVPADYFFWFMRQTWANDWPNMVKYFHENRAALDMEMEEMGK